MQIKVVWICAFSNPKVREHFTTKINPILRFILKKKGHPVNTSVDYGIWNSNAIKEFEKIKDIDLHIISPIRYLSKKEVRFDVNGIHYYFFRDENSNLISQLYYQLVTKNKSLFIKNRKHVRTLVKEINPEIVHVIGAENPYYSLALLDIPDKIPTIIQLQALLDRLVENIANQFEKKNIAYKGRLERQIIDKADYVGTEVVDFKEYIKEEIKPETKFLDISIAMGNEINLTEDVKVYDFVYFAAGINENKAGDVALKSFAIAHQLHPEITLNIIGKIDEDFRKILDEIISKNRLENAVFIEGKLPTHNDVISQIRKSKYALLPLKYDFVPNTIREAMSNGLPVVTTITENGTTKLNEKRESVLLSKPDDHNAIAKNMIKLIENPSLAETLKKNAAISEKERINNYEMMLKWTDVYKKIKSNR
jgi:glycosyltransferase involved in cell wall biosynthesis